MSQTRFPIRIEPRFALFLGIVFGATPERAWVELTDDQLTARYGRWEFRVPVEHISRWRVEGPWRAITAIGVRRSIRHGDFTFAGSARGGVRLDFHSPVHWLIFRVPALYVGVDDLEGFAASLSERGIAGEDARRDTTEDARRDTTEDARRGTTDSNA
jgi:hypothetical protein